MSRKKEWVTSEHWSDGDEDAEDNTGMMKCEEQSASDKSSGLRLGTRVVNRGRHSSRG